MLFQPANDQILVGIQLAWALSCLAAGFVAGLVQPFAHSLDVESGLGCELTGTQVELPAQTADFMVGFKINHAPSTPERRSSRSISTIALSERLLPSPSVTDSGILTL